MPRYPRNPYQVGGAGKVFGIDALATNYAYHAQFLYQIDYNDASTEVRAEMDPPLGDADIVNVSSIDVAGYDLTAMGSERTKGQDLDDSVLNSTGNHYRRTGYLTLRQERNPWIEAGMWGNRTSVRDFDERPFSDGVADFIIIHLGSGMDRKIGNDQSQANQRISRLIPYLEQTRMFPVCQQSRSATLCVGWKQIYQ